MITAPLRTSTKALCSAVPCPRCESRNCKKKGFNAGKQRYMCRDCGRDYRVDGRPKRDTEELQQALFSEIERSHGLLDVALRRIQLKRSQIDRWVESFPDFAERWAEISTTTLTEALKPGDTVCVSRDSMYLAGAVGKVLAVSCDYVKVRSQRGSVADIPPDYIVLIERAATV